MLILGMYHVLVVFWSGAVPDFSCEPTGFNYLKSTTNTISKNLLRP